MHDCQYAFEKFEKNYKSLIYSYEQYYPEFDNESVKIIHFKLCKAMGWGIIFLRSYYASHSKTSDLSKTLVFAQQDGFLENIHFWLSSVNFIDGLPTETFENKIYLFKEIVETCLFELSKFSENVNKTEFNNQIIIPNDTDYDQITVSKNEEINLISKIKQKFKNLFK